VDIVEAYIQEQRIQGRVVQKDAEDVAGAQALKTLILSTSSCGAIAVVLPAAARLDKRKLAKHLGVSSSSVDLVATDGVVESCGFPVGVVPPFGHQPSIRILVDPSGQSGTVVGGCGDSSLKLVTTWEAVVEAPLAEEARLVKEEAVRSGSHSSSGGEKNLQEASSKDVAESEPDTDSEATRGLDSFGRPAPVWGWLTEREWIMGFRETPTAPLSTPGAMTVEVEGQVLHRRRQSRCLLFITLSEESTGFPAAVADMLPWQAVVGRAFKEAHGTEEAAEAIRQVREGSRLRMRGRIQVNPRRGIDLVVSEFDVLEDAERADQPCNGTPEPPSGEGKASQTTAAPAPLPSSDSYPRLHLPVPFSWIDTPEGAHQVVSAVRQHSLVAIDCEWRPRPPRKLAVALLQLAVEDHVYLIDIIGLAGGDQREGEGRGPAASILASLFEEGPSRPDTVLLYGTQDLHQLAAAVPSAAQLTTTATNVMDLRKEALPLGAKGLSQACQLLLGHSLDKSEQRSDWERRPLTDAQACYAALDAYCLLLLQRKLTGGG